MKVRTHQSAHHMLSKLPCMYEVLTTYVCICSARCRCTKYFWNCIWLEFDPNVSRWPIHFKYKRTIHLYLVFWKIKLEMSSWKYQVGWIGILVYFKLDFYCLCSLQISSSNSKKNRVSKSIFFFRVCNKLPNWHFKSIFLKHNENVSKKK